MVLLYTDQFFPDHFLHLGFEDVHHTDPLRWINSFQFFRNTCLLRYRRDYCFQQALSFSIVSFRIYSISFSFLVFEYGRDQQKRKESHPFAGAAVFSTSRAFRRDPARQSVPFPPVSAQIQTGQGSRGCDPGSRNRESPPRRAADPSGG